MSQLCHRCWQYIQESKHILPLIRLNWTKVPRDDIQLCYWLFNSSSIKYIVTQTHLMCEKNSYPRKQLEIRQMNSQQTHNSLSQVVKKLKHMKTHFVSSVCVCVCVCLCVLVAQSCLTLCDPVDCSPPGSSVQGILQARILEWVAISFSRGSSQGLNLSLPHCRQIVYHPSHQESPLYPLGCKKEKEKLLHKTSYISLLEVL